MTLFTRFTLFTRTLPLPAALLLAGGLMAVSLPAASSEAGATARRLCQSQTAPVGGGAYTVENNEWGSSAPECVTTDGGPDFTVASSSIANSTSGAPGGYAAIYKGCHWGACTPGSGLPIRVPDIRARKVTTSWSTSQPGGSAYDVAYDVWFSQTPAAHGQPDGTELMIWLNHHGPVQPFGAKVASNVSIGSRGYNVWFGKQGWNTVSYTMTSGTTSVSNLDLQPLIADAVRRGYISTSWYLVDVEAGFEIWQGGRGLATSSFSVKVAGGGTSSPTAPPPGPAPSTSPAPPSPSPSSPAPSPSPSPAPARSPHLSLQAVSPSSPTPGTSTNVTVDYKNVGPVMASGLTLVIDVLNPAGKIAGSWSRTGQDVAPQQTQNLSYAWTAPARAGTYTIEAAVQAPSGTTLGHAQVGTVTVK